jgi:K+-transporting ATPase ATPase A chain
MTASGWIQLVLILGTITLLTKPLGIYLVRVLDPEREGGTFLDPVLRTL